MTVFDSNNHSVFSLNHHLVLVVKYRRKVITRRAILDQIETMAREIGALHGVEVREFNGEADHVHLLLRSKPNTTMSAYINSLKSATSRVVKRLFPEVKQKLWREQFWSNSYCLISVGGAPLEVLHRYIASQDAPGGA
jgi:putative transposase